MKKKLFNHGLWLKIMKQSIIQMVLAVCFMGLCYSRDANAQEILETRISIRLEDKSVKTILASLEKEVKVKFMYSAEVIQADRIASIKVKNQSFGEVLEAFLNPLNISYRSTNSGILLTPKAIKLGLLQGMEKPKFEIPMPAEITIKGTVTDENGEKLPGVSITLKGTTRGSSTNVNGEYSIAVPDDKTVLVFSFVGYVTQEVAVGNRTNFSVILKVENKALDEVVVVGYGTVKKSDLTGSVAKVGEAEIKATPIVALDRALQGRVTGVQVTQNSSKPGGATTIRIRGSGSFSASNEPLYVVDGYPMNDISTINPNDIESIEILKDASATAIYGSRGSNGVVIITSTRGKSGQNSVVFESYYGIQSVRRKIPLLNSMQYAEFINEARINGGGVAYFNGSSSERALPSMIANNTDWQNEVFQDAPIQNFQLNLSGGNDKTRYSISGNYYDQQGVIQNSYFKRYTVRTNLDHEINTKIKVGVSLLGSFINSNEIRSETGGQGDAGVTAAALSYAPVFPVYRTEGIYYTDLGTLNGQQIDNPVAIANDIVSRNYNIRLLSNAFLQINLAKGLNLRTSWGADLQTAKNNFYATRLTLIGASVNGSASITNSQNIGWLNENTLTYDTKVRGKDSFNALLGYTVQKLNFENVNARSATFNDDFALYNNLGNGSTLQTPSSSATEWALISYLARINYNLANRFLFTLTARTDGSSRFGPNNKYGFFPSGAFGWRLINEKFMQNQKLFSDLKLRASYGFAGNQEIGNYQYLSSIVAAPSAFGGVYTVGGASNGVSNNDLRWEKNAQFDIGADLGILENKIQLSADYYIKTTSALLFQVNIPQSTGFSSSLQNIGSIQNRGFEFNISSANINTSKFKWTSSFNLSFNKNKVINLDGRAQIIAGVSTGNVSNYILTKVGEPVGNFYGRIVEGIFQNQAEIDGSAQRTAKPGDFRFKDLNNDGVINDNDRAIIGNPNPDFFGGIDNTFKYLNFDLNVFIQGQFGNEILNFQRFELLNLNGQNNQSTDVLNRWTPTNPSNSIPRANSAGGQRIFSSFHVEDGSYLRVKNISLGYNLPSEMIKKVGVKSAKVYLTAQNFITFTRYNGYDPEVNRFGSTSSTQGLDYGAYPANKTLLVGLNFKF
jgi:TonB-dependent starch-binding outer membrane protein SusC